MLNGPMRYLFPREPNDTLIPNPKCSVISLGENGSVLSNIPLSIAVYSYTFFYLFIFILNLGNSDDNKGVLGDKGLSSRELSTAFRQNIPIMILFPLLFVLESLWIVNNNCVWKPLFFILTSFIVGAGVGVLWALIITSIKNNSLMYLSNAGVEVCSRPSQTYFRCKVVPKTVTN
jgi:magnesium-transporting ATPase (P-type)